MSKELLVHLLYRGDKKQPDIEDDYIKEFSAKGLVAKTVPILKFEFKNLIELSDILFQLNANNLNGLIISSPRVVEALWDSINLLEHEKRKVVFGKIEPKLTFVIGQKSAKDCSEKLNINYNIESISTGDGQSLARYIYDYCKENYSNQKIYLLYPKSSLSDNVVQSFLNQQSNFIHVHSLVVYETSVISSIADSTIEAINEIINKQSGLVSKLILNLVFFSPSGVNGYKMENTFLNKLKLAFPNLDFELKHSCIGTTTHAELLRNNFDVFCVSEKPNPKSLTESIIRSMKRK